MKTPIFLIIFAMLSVACSVSNSAQTEEKQTEEKQKTITKPRVYEEVLFQNITLKVEGKYLPLTLATFTNTESDLIGRKRLFELYGNWEKALSTSLSKHPLLIWENVPLLNDGRLVNIIVGGKLIKNSNQVSFFIYDSKTKKNLLAEKSPYRAPILKKIQDLLETNEPKNKAFEKKFWKDFYFVDIQS
ncbi:MAG: hypothetical protein ACK5MD_00200 [Flavobacteriales bacterium]